MMENLEYQTRAARWLSTRRRGIVQIPAGGGKSRVAAMALNMVITAKPRTEKVKIGWLAPTIETREQGLAAMREFPSVMAQDIRVECVSPIASMDDRDILIVDECKHSPAEVWQGIILKCRNRWGLDATPFGEDEERNQTLMEMFGQVFTVSRDEVKARVASARVIMMDATDDGLRERIDEAVVNCFPKRLRAMRWLAANKGLKVPSDQEIHGQLLFQKCVEIGILGNSKRNQQAIHLAVDCVNAGDSVLMLVNQIEHAKSLAEQIPGSVATYAGMGAKKRRETMAAFRSGDVKCLVVTSGLASEGLDVPRCNVLILVSGGRSKSKVEQQTGRALRVFAGKSHAVIADWKDEFHPLTAKHSRVRQKLYESLGYSFG